MSNFVVIGSVEDRRIQLWQAALQRLGLPPATLVTYQQLASGAITLDRCLHPGDVLRIESPGKSADTEQLLLKLGEPLVEPQFLRTETATLTPQKGRVYSTRQWYLGLCQLLDKIDRQRADAPPHQVMNGTNAIRTMFDKRATQQLLQSAQLPIPPTLPPISSYSELRDQMAAHNMRRVFIKLAHGSSASGAIAYETNGPQEKATTTATFGDNGHLFNSRQIRTLRDGAEIKQLVNTICQQRVHVESWLPKGSLCGQRFDVRVLVINGHAQHSIVRLSRTPFTNLHLLNDRAPIDTLIGQIGEEAWRAAQHTCERATACFPDAFYAGVDLLFTPDRHRHYVLELNAFGDLLPTVRVADMDSYELEIRAVRSRLAI